MANHKGSEGIVQVAAGTVAELLDYSIDETADTIEDSELSDTAKTFQSDMTSWTGSINAMWDETDTVAQGAMVIGASVAVIFLPEGNVTGDISRTGTAIITSKGMAASKGSMVTQSFGLQGTGALVEGTVA